MTRKRTRRDESRREFVKTVAMAGGAAAVVSVTGTVSADESVEMETTTDRKGKKYKVTPHISTYYKTARI